jgi:hypothetical protein
MTAVAIVLCGRAFVEIDQLFLRGLCVLAVTLLLVSGVSLIRVYKSHRHERDA